MIHIETNKEQNRALCERYPFLIPSNRFSGKRITEAADGFYWPWNPEEVPKYDFEYTELDDMPDGWRVAFGEQLCEDLKQELLKAGGDALYKYRIVQIKEKWGFLHWYDNGCTERWQREILPKYEKMSKRICVCCGKPATLISTGWVSPWCNDCAELIRDSFVPIDAWFKKEEPDTAEDD